MLEDAARKSAAEPPVTSRRRAPAPAPIIVFVLFVVMIGLSIWYLSRREPLVVQGEVQSRTFDLAARVDGRVGEIVVARSQDVTRGAPLLRIDNPELLAREQASEATFRVAEAELARVRAGFRAETIAARKAEIDRADADLTLAQKTFERTRQLVASHNSPQSQLDKDRAALTLAERTRDQARFAYDEAASGFTREDLGIALAKVETAKADVETLKALVAQMVVVAPADAQVFRIPVEDGEFVLPGVPQHARVVGSLRPQHRRGAARQDAALLRRADADVRADGRHSRPVARRQLPWRRGPDRGLGEPADRRLPDDRRLMQLLARNMPVGLSLTAHHRLACLRLCRRRFPVLAMQAFPRAGARSCHFAGISRSCSTRLRGVRRCATRRCRLRSSRHYHRSRPACLAAFPCARPAGARHSRGGRAVAAGSGARRSGAFAAEWRRALGDRGVFGLFVLAPVLYAVFYPQPYLGQIVRNIPIAVVDQDHSELGRGLIQALDAHGNISVALRASSYREAEDAIFARRAFAILAFRRRPRRTC